MRGVHFQTENGVDIIGLSDKAKAAACAGLAFPGEVVAPERDLAPGFPCHGNFPMDFVEVFCCRTWTVTDVWLTMDGEYRLRSEYSFAGLPDRRVETEQFVDIRYNRYVSGAMLPVDDQLWFVLMDFHFKEWEEPLPIHHLSRSARHAMFGGFRLDEEPIAAHEDLARAMKLEPVWCAGKLAKDDDQYMLMDFEDAARRFPDTVPELEEFVRGFDSAPRL